MPQGRWITPQYFSVLGIPLRRGRWLAESDRGKPCILINERLARRFFPQQDAVGKQLIFGVLDPALAAAEIVGVVGDVSRYGTLEHEEEWSLRFTA